MLCVRSRMASQRTAPCIDVVATFIAISYVVISANHLHSPSTSSTNSVFILFPDASTHRCIGCASSATNSVFLVFLAARCNFIARFGYCHNYVVCLWSGSHLRRMYCEKADEVKKTMFLLKNSKIDWYGFRLHGTIHLGNGAR